MPFNKSTDAIRRVLARVGVDPSTRLDANDQDPEYTSCRREELAAYFLIYRDGSIDPDERAVLSCFMLESLNDFCAAGSPHPLQAAILDALLDADDTHADEIAYWSDSGDPNPGNRWPIAEHILRHRAARSCQAEGAPKEVQLDLGAVIYPNEGAAGLVLGATVDALRRLPQTRVEQHAGQLERLDHGPVVVWARNGLIEQVCVRAGYAGQVLATGVHVGDTLGKATSALGVLVEDAEDGLVAVGIPGLSFETEAWEGVPGHETPGENLGVAITEIHVFRAHRAG